MSSAYIYPGFESFGGSKWHGHLCGEYREGATRRGDTAGPKGKRSHAQRSRNSEAGILEHTRCMLFLPQTRTMFPFEMVGSTAV